MQNTEAIGFYPEALSEADRYFFQPRPSGVFRSEATIDDLVKLLNNVGIKTRFEGEGDSRLLVTTKKISEQRAAFGDQDPSEAIMENSFDARGLLVQTVVLRENSIVPSTISSYEYDETSEGSGEYVLRKITNGMFNFGRQFMLTDSYTYTREGGYWKGEVSHNLDYVQPFNLLFPQGGKSVEALRQDVARIVEMSQHSPTLSVHDNKDGSQTIFLFSYGRGGSLHGRPTVMVAAEYTVRDGLIVEKRLPVSSLVGASVEQELPQYKTYQNLQYNYENGFLKQVVVDDEMRYEVITYDQTGERIEEEGSIDYKIQ